MTSQVERQANLLSDCLRSLTEWKNLIDEHFDDPDKAAELAHLEEIAKDYCIAEHSSKKSAKSVHKVVDYYNNPSNDQSVDVDTLFKQNREPDDQNYDYKQSQIWKQVVQGAPVNRDVEEVENTADASQESAVFEEMQDSLFYSNVFTPPVDPISKGVIKDPYKSKTCGHIYENKYIRQYIKSMRNKAKCPYIGCGNKSLTMGELVQDSQTKEKIENYLKTQQETSETSSHEEE